MLAAHSTNKQHDIHLIGYLKSKLFTVIFSLLFTIAIDAFCIYETVQHVDFISRLNEFVTEYDLTNAADYTFISSLTIFLLRASNDKLITTVEGIDVFSNGDASGNALYLTATKPLLFKTDSYYALGKQFNIIPQDSAKILYLASSGDVCNISEFKNECQICNDNENSSKILSGGLSIVYSEIFHRIMAMYQAVITLENQNASQSEILAQISLQTQCMKIKQLSF